MLTGRERELDLLGRIMDTLREGQDHVGAVLLSGESGIGKSALLAALRASALERGFGIGSWVAHERAFSPPGAPWLSLMEQIGHPVAAELGSIVELGRDTWLFQAGQAIASALRAAARSQPRVLILDDLQWLDPASRDLLVHVIHAAIADSAPILFATAWRVPTVGDDAFRATIADLLRIPHTERIELTGLDIPGIATLAANAGLALPPATVRQLAERTGGNPFYVTETIRLMAAQGETGNPVDSRHPPPIPDSVQQVIRARVAALPAALPIRHVLERIAVFPRSVSFALIAEMTELPDEVLMDALDAAIAHGLLIVAPDDSERFAFPHPIAREAILASGNPVRRARLHRQAAVALERMCGPAVEIGEATGLAGDIALHYALSRSLPGSECGIPFALQAADEAMKAAAFEQAAMFSEIALQLAANQPLAERARIEVQHAIALANALRMDEAVAGANAAIRALQDAGVPADDLAEACWHMASILNAGGASPAVVGSIQSCGLAALGDRRDLPWARLRLLDNPIALVPNDVLFAARWLGFDPLAQSIVRQSDSESDQVLAIESFDVRSPHQSRELIAQARRWTDPRATLRGLTAAANDLTYSHAEFRHAIRLWQEILRIAQEHGATPWQANALNQITLLHVALGAFAEATAAKHEADAINARLGPANDSDALHMERDFALTVVLDGDWQDQAGYWLEFAGDPPIGLEGQLNAPLYAAMAAAAAARAGIETPRALALVDALADVVTHPGIVQVNGVIAWAIDAIHTLGDRRRAARFDRLAADLLATGEADYPQTSLLLSRARMLSLLDDSRAAQCYRQARETLAATGQTPLLGIATFEQAVAPFTPPAERHALLDAAETIFSTLQMTTWRERVHRASTVAPPAANPAGLSARELDVLRLIARGYPDRRVADDLFISERTVHAHMRAMLRKTETANRTELSIWARDRGILERDPGSHS